MLRQNSCTSARCLVPATQRGGRPRLGLSDCLLCQGPTSDMGGPSCRLCSEQTRQLPECSLASSLTHSLARQCLAAPAHLSVGVVGVPRGPQRLLASNVPHQEVSVLHHDFFHVAADGGRRVHHLLHQAGWSEIKTQSWNWSATSQNNHSVKISVESKKCLQLVEDSGFPRIVQSHDDHLVLCGDKMTCNNLRPYSHEEQHAGRKAAIMRRGAAQCIALKSKSQRFLPQNRHDLIFSTFPFFFSHTNTAGAVCHSGGFDGRQASGLNAEFRVDTEVPK